MMMMMMMMMVHLLVVYLFLVPHISSTLTEKDDQLIILGCQLD
jgi:hypothetical protein